MKQLVLLSAGVLGLVLTTAAQTATPAQPAAAPPPQTSPVAAPAQAVPATTTPLTTPAAPTNNVADPSATNATPATAEIMAPTVKLGPDEIMLNFKNAPIESVLKYLSDAAGFIINVRTPGELRGKLTVFSGHPITRDEALEQLNAALDQNGYTAVRIGRTLLIFNKEDAKRQEELPVKVSSKPADIPKNGEMVTQIIPLHYISAVQVARDLQSLLPEKATMSSNEGGNSIIITDTQASIHRMAEIINALDTAISSVSSVRVFQLHYADAKALAGVIKDLFSPQDTTARAANAAGANRFQNQFRGGGPGGFAGGPGGFGGAPGGGAAAAGDANGGRASAPKVVAVADERSNSIVVSAPEEQMPIIAELIQKVDTNVEDVTEVRVFHLHYADAQETADLLTSLFSPSSSTSNNNNNQGFFRGAMQFAGGRFGGPFGGGGAGGGNRGNTAAADESTRLQKQTQVVAVPDLRTGSVIVSASHDSMKQIEPMIRELDMDPAKKQQVYVFDFQNTDPSQAVTILQSLFPNQQYGANSNSRLNQNQAGTGNQLNTRATQNQNNFQRAGSGSSGGLGGSGLGGSTAGR